jgi:hypothetical protein
MPAANPLNSSVRIVLALAIGSSMWQFAGARAARAQGIVTDNPNFQTRLPAFQNYPRESLESQILDRLAQTGRYEPGDLARLARLAVLNALSMQVNVRYDMTGPAGTRMQQEIAGLWDAAEAFYETVSAGDIDASNLERTDFLFTRFIAAQNGLDSSLAAFPALSDRAAGRLGAVTQLTGVMSSVLADVESNVLSTLPAPASRTIDLDAMRAETRLLASDLVVLIQNVKDFDRDGKRTALVQRELETALARVQRFEESVPLDLSLKELQETYRAARRQLWYVEAAMHRLEWPANVKAQWHRVRERINAVSNGFGLPRVIENPPNSSPAASAHRRLAAGVDRAVAWVDEFLAEQGPRLRKTPAGTRFASDAANLRNQLRQLRRLALANESENRLVRLTREIETASGQLINRAAEFARASDGVDLIPGLRGPALAINDLRGLIAENGAPVASGKAAVSSAN